MVVWNLEFRLEKVDKDIRPVVVDSNFKLGVTVDKLKEKVEPEVRDTNRLVKTADRVESWESIY